jgi:hypothetical protein
MRSDLLDSGEAATAAGLIRQFNNAWERNSRPSLPRLSLFRSQALYIRVHRAQTNTKSFLNYFV